VLDGLGILSSFDLADHPLDSADSVHLQIEAVKLAFADAYRFVGDPKAMQRRRSASRSRTTRLRRPPNAHRHEARAEPAQALRPGRHGLSHRRGASGMMVSMIQSNFFGLRLGRGRSRTADQPAEPRLWFRF